jgi:hypothetical protein
MAAFILRYWHLTTLPPGYWFDEAHKSLVALEIVRGLRAPIYVTDYDGIESGFFWLLAGWFKLFGPSYFGARALSALLGALTIPITFWTARTLYRDHPRADLIGLTSAGLLSVLLWHVHWSRLGLETISVPLFAVALLGLMAWAWQRGALWAFALAGAVLGLGQYTNPGARVLPLQAFVVFVIFAVPQVRSGRLPVSRALVTKVATTSLMKTLQFGLVFFFAALVVYAPLGLFFWQNPQWFLARIAFTSSGARAGGLPFYFDNAIKTLLSLNFLGDPRPRHNLASRPALDWVASAWMWGGVVAMFLSRPRWRSHLAVMAALIANIIPMIFSDGAPGFGRTLGLTPMLVMLPALGVTAVVEWAIAIASRRNRSRRWLWAAVVLSLALSAGVNVYDYFWRYPKQAGLFEAFEVGFRAITQGAARAGTGFLILDEPALAHPTLRLTRELSSNDLRIINGQTCFAYPARATDETTFAVLPQWIPSVLAQYPTATQTDILHEPEVYQYAAVLKIPAGQVSASGAGEAIAKFGDQFELLALELPAEVASPGQAAPLMFRWRAVAPSAISYTSFVHLVGDGKPLVAGVDGEPCAGWYPTNQWHPGEVVEYQLALTLPPDLAPGVYELAVGMYDWTTGERLPVSQARQREPDRAIAGTIVIK